MTCMTVCPGSVVVVGVRQQGQEACALDSGIKLTLVVGLGTGQASRDDLAIFLNEITQGVEIFVIDLFNTRSRETAELAALEKRILLGETALSVPASFELSHDMCLFNVRAQPGMFLRASSVSARASSMGLLHNGAATAGKQAFCLLDMQD